MIDSSITNAYVGNAQLTKICQGSNVVWQAGPPADVSLNYISNGSARANPVVYYSTGFNPSLTTKVEIKFSIHKKETGKILFGSANGGISGTTNSGTRFYFDIYNTITASSNQYTTCKFQCKTGNYGFTGNSSLYSLDTPHVASMGLNGATSSSATGLYFNFDGNNSSKTGAYSSAMTESYHLYMFALHSNGSNSSYGASLYPPADTRIYYMKIWSGSTLVRSYVPVLHYNNGAQVPCFYDTVNKNYIYNLGTDTPSYEVL